jgi:CDP-diacylglycerol---glycerol-3-phosphate 3-phosphatidyltransferase
MSMRQDRRRRKKLCALFGQAIDIEENYIFKAPILSPALPHFPPQSRLMRKLMQPQGLTTPYLRFQHYVSGGSMPTLYSIKPAFQNLLRPIAAGLVKIGATANIVTISAALLSIATGIIIARFHTFPNIFWLLPGTLFLRMALNAIDGMMAREFGQKSALGMYLNELTDAVSDAALILPFALLGPFPAWGVMLFALIAVLTEYAGALGVMAGGARRYDGPFGKSDRALALGVLAALLASGAACEGWGFLVFPILALLSALTVVNRVRAGLQEGKE